MFSWMVVGGRVFEVDSIIKSAECVCVIKL